MVAPRSQHARILPVSWELSPSQAKSLVTPGCGPVTSLWAWTPPPRAGQASAQVMRGQGPPGMFLNCLAFTYTFWGWSSHDHPPSPYRTREETPAGETRTRVL